MARNINSDPFNLNKWIADYLAERGYATTLRSLRLDTQNDRALNVENLVEYLLHCVSILNFPSLIETWGDLDRRLFCRLNAEHMKAAIQLETRLLQLFMVTSLLRGNVKKAQECLEFMANSPRLSEDSDLRDWFRVPYIKNAETDPLTAKYCSKFWQDTLSVSLYNFISSVYHTAYSSLQSQRLKTHIYEEGYSATAEVSSRLRQRKLQDNFDRTAGWREGQTDGSRPSTSTLRSKFNRAISSLNAQTRRPVSGEASSSVVVTEKLPSSPSPLPDPHSNRSSPTLTLRVAPTRPRQPRQRSSASECTTLDSSRPSRVGVSGGLAGALLSPRSRISITPDRSSPFQSAPNIASRQLSTEYLFHLVCEEDFGSHDSPLVECVLSSCGKKVASFDSRNCVKVWKGVPPATKLISTFQSPAKITCLRWTAGSDDLIVLGDERGNVTLLDGAAGTLVMEINVGSTVTALSVFYDETTSYAACGSHGSEESQHGIFVIDIATFTIRNELRHASLLTACKFHKNKPLLLCGFNTGEICEFNPKFQKFSAKLSVHSATVLQVEYLPDEAFCVSSGNDGMLIISHLSMGGRKLADITLGKPCPNASPPFQRRFVLNHDGSLSMVRCDDGVKIYKVNSGRLAASLSLEKQIGTVTSIDWHSVLDKSTGIFGYSDGRIRWFRLLHLA